jgi:Na+/melibiose symporter-like transporter
MRIDRNLKLLECHSALASMLFVVGVLVPYYRDRMGLTFDDFLLGEAFFAATIVLLDVPTGWISDQWQRKHILALGSCIEAAGCLLLLMAHNIVMAVAAQAILGVGVSLISGTNSATLYESLLAAGREGEYRRREGRRAGIGLYAIAAASIAGGLLYPYHHHLLPALVTVLVHCVAIVVACLLDEPPRHRKAPEKHPVLDMIETGRYALRHPVVGLLLAYASVMFCTTKLIMWSQQSYYVAMGVPEQWFGVLMAAGFFLGGSSSHAAHLLDGRVDTRKVLACVWATAAAACLVAASRLGWIGSCALMVGGSCLYGIANPRVSEAINRHVDPTRRATVLSTQSLLVSLMFIPLSRGVGIVSRLGGVQLSLLALAAWLGLAGLCLVLLWRRRSVAASAAAQPA